MSSLFTFIALMSLFPATNEVQSPRENATPEGTILKGNVEGIEVTFKVEKEGYLGIGSGKEKEASIDQTIRQAITIPSKIIIGTTEYEIRKINSYGFCNTKVSKVVVLGNIEKVESSIFEGSEVEEVEIGGEGIEELGDRSFYGCYQLTTIKLGKDETKTGGRLKRLGGYCFFGCSKLKSVRVDSVESVGEECFSESGLENAEFGSVLVEVGSGCFRECLSLKSVKMKLSSGLTLFGVEHFMQSEVEIVELPESLRIIPSRCFYECVNLKQINFPKELEEVHNESFYRCYLISKIDLTNTKITKIMNSAFFQCTGDKNIILPPSLEFAGSMAFDNDYFTDIVLSNLKEIEESAFEYIHCNTIDISESPLTEIPKYGFSHGYMKAIKLPKTLKIVKERAFTYNTLLESIEFPSTLEIMYEKALRQCSRISSIDLGHTQLTEISVCLFEQCANLSRVILPMHAKPLKLLEGAFRNAGIERIEFPPNTEAIGKDCFEYCKKLEFVDLENCKVKRLENSAFYSCTALETILFGNSIEEIGEYCFFSAKIKTFRSSTIKEMGQSALCACKKMEILDLSECPMKTVPNGMCYGNRALKTAKLPKQATMIDVEALYLCNSLSSVEFPSELVAIKKDAFLECFSLKTLDFSRTNLQFIESRAFGDCWSLKSIMWSPVIESIEEEAFAGCWSLTKLMLTKTMRDLSTKCFAKVGVVELDLRTFEGLLKESLFEGCSNLSEIRWPRGEYSVGESCFNGCNGVKEIKVSDLLTEAKEGGFRGMRGLEVADLSLSSLKFLSERLFEGDEALKRIILPSNLGTGSPVSAFGFRCFYKCKIEEVIYLGTNSFSKVGSPFDEEYLKVVNVSSGYFELYSDFCGYPIQIHPGSEDEGDSDTSNTLEETESIKNDETTESVDNELTESMNDNFTESLEEDLTESKDDLNIETETNVESKDNNGNNEYIEEEGNPDGYGKIIGGSISGSVLFIGALVGVFFIYKRQNRKRTSLNNVYEHTGDMNESNDSEGNNFNNSLEAIDDNDNIIFFDDDAEV